ncbi:MAG: hypothetical protein MMC33_005675 [Icmadophila ericetorum]|nr:hypothetical protein [Icmadophila ericetorum]
MTKIQTMKYHHLLSILRLTTAILFNLTLPCLLLSPHQFSKISLLALLSSAHLEISIYASLLISISLVEFAFAIADSSIFIAPRSGWATLAAGGGLLQRLRYLTTTLTFPPSLLLFLLTLALYASLFPLMERERVLDEFFARPFLIGVGKITVLVLLLGAVVLVVLGAVEPGVKVVQWGLRGLEGGMGRMKERGFWKG